MNRVSICACNISNDGLSALAKGSSNMVEDLIVSECRNISDAGIIAVAENWRRLKCFHCTYMVASILTDVALIAMGNNCCELSSVSLERCPLITSVGLSALARGCSKLTDLTLINCPQITDEGVFDVANYCKQLTCFSTSESTALTDAAVMSLAEGCPKLQSVQTGLSVGEETMNALKLKKIVYSKWLS